MKLEDRTDWAIGLLAKIHVITGWIVPENELMNILVDQFEKKLYESYPTVNPDEVEFAFRTEGTKVKDWGKSMNLSLIDEVMYPYLSKRFELSKLEEQVKTKKSMYVEIKENLSDVTMNSWWEYIEDQVRNKGYKLDFIPIHLYEWKVDKGEINKTKEEKFQYAARAAEYRKNSLAKIADENDSKENREAFEKFCDMVKNGFIQGKEYNIVINLAKKIIVLEMMTAPK